MKNPQTHLRFSIMLCSLAIFICSITVAEPLGTAFTYQGHFYDANYVADGLYDFQFKLYDADVSGNQLGGDVNVPDVDVIDGYFTTLLDFGSGVFNGNSCWLEISVRPGDSTGSFTKLSPRQELTPTPYALHSHGLLMDNTNTIVGENSGMSNMTGSGNTALGYYALNDNTSGAVNTAIGYLALRWNTTGGWNTAIGDEALYRNTTGDDNTAVGKNANLYNQAGSRNTIIGKDAGRGTSLHNKNDNIFIGYQAGYYETGDDKLYIENSDSNIPLIYGEFDNDIVAINGDLGIGVSSPDSTLHVKAGNWNITDNEGDFKIGNSDYRFKIGVATSGGGAGDVFMRAVGGSNKLKIGAGTSNVLIVSESGVGIGTTSLSEKLEVDGNVVADNMPGCEFTGSIDITDIPNAWMTITAVDLDVASAGYVIVTFSGSVNFDSAGPIVEVGIGTSSSTVDSKITSTVNTTGQYIPFSVQHVYTISSAGTYTYYGNAKASDAISDIYDAKVTAIYVPNKY